MYLTAPFQDAPWTTTKRSRSVRTPNPIRSTACIGCSRNDFTLIQGMVMLLALFYVVVNLVVDLLYAVFDPRIRYN